MSSRRREQPPVDDVAGNVGLTPMRLAQVLQRWASLTTTAFLRAISVEHVRELLRSSAAALDEAHPVGLSGPAAPCHPALGRSGALTGYYWGLARKQAMIAWEAGRVVPPRPSRESGIA